MKAVIDSGGRVLRPKQRRDALGLTPGTTVVISAYGTGVQVTPGAARPHERHRAVAERVH